MDVWGTSGVFSWLDGAEGEGAFGGSEHASPVLEVRIGGPIIFVLGVVISAGCASLPDFDDHIIEGFLVDIDDDSFDDDLFTIGDWGVVGEACQVGIEVLLFFDVRNWVEGAFGLWGGWWEFSECFLDCV